MPRRARRKIGTRSRLTPPSITSPWCSVVWPITVASNVVLPTQRRPITRILSPGGSVSVIGRNGVGKTTLLATVMGHTTLHHGEVTLGGASLQRVPVFRRARRGLGWVPQEREIF